MGGEFTYQPKWDPKTVLTTAGSFRKDSGNWILPGKTFKQLRHEASQPNQRNIIEGRRLIFLPHLECRFLLFLFGGFLELPL